MDTNARHKKVTPGKKGAFHQRPANSYRMNPLALREEFEAGLQALIDKAGPKKAMRAVELSAQLNEPSDLEDISTFVDLINKHGYEKVQKANEETAKKRIETGFRDIFYTIRLLQQ